MRRENTGDIADGIANAGRGLVRDLLHCHHVDRLRHVDQRRVGAHRRNAPGRLVGGFRLTVVDCSIGHGYAAEHGGLLVVEVANESSEPFALALLPEGGPVVLGSSRPASTVPVGS